MIPFTKSAWVYPLLNIVPTALPKQDAIWLEDDVWLLRTIGCNAGQHRSVPDELGVTKKRA